MKNRLEIYKEIFDDIEINNIKGYIELIDIYQRKKEYDKLYEIKKNRNCFFEYIKSRNRELKQKFDVKEFFDKIIENQET